MEDVKFKCFHNKDKRSEKGPDFTSKFVLDGKKMRIAQWRNDDGSLYTVIGEDNFVPNTSRSTTPSEPIYKQTEASSFLGGLANQTDGVNGGQESDDLPF